MTGDRIGVRFGRVIYQLRTQRKWSLEKLGMAAGVSKGQLSMIENGMSNPTLVTVEKVARAFGMRLHTLVEMFE